MTQPDEYFPDTSANYSSLASFAAKTETDWNDELDGNEITRWGNVNTGMRGGLDLNYPLPVAILRYIAYQLGLGGVLDTLDAVGSAIGNFWNTASANASTALTNVTTLAANLLGTPEAVIGNITNVITDGVHTIQDWFNSLGSAFGGAASGNDVTSVASAASAVTSTANTASTNASTAISNVTTLKSALQGEYTVEVLTADGTWTVPAGEIIEFWAICIGAGEDGANRSGLAGGAGGLAGKFLAQNINPADLGTAGSSISYTVPAGGSGLDAVFGSLASSAGGSIGAIASPFGFYDATISTPGNGGDGGSSSATSSNVTAGTAGGSTPLGAGGSGGARSTSASAGGAGGDGGDADNSAQSRAGGGGGGGGGGSYTGPGGNGGNGGDPGGGGGGGGGGTSGGTGGGGGRAEIILAYKVV